jgi:hypothetical protein
MTSTIRAAFALLLLGCSSSSSPASGSDGGGGGGGNSVNGAIVGASIVVADGFFSVATPSQSTTGITEESVDVRLTNYPGACALPSTGDSHKAGSVYAKISMRTKSAGGTPIAAGTFNVVSGAPDTGAYAEFELETLDSTCNGTKHEATGGTVTLTKITSTEVAGTFDVTSDNGSASGSFDVQTCTEAIDGGLGCVK